ncbi:hypothetical protein DFH06DRAFT_309687 [Mycena polygramma]|nr:hypothetical protein DFH06DRAFT_309687 [Mycena polygramma]
MWPADEELPEHQVLREQRHLKIKAIAHRYFFIPDEQLPEPWTCKWETWHALDWKTPPVYEVGTWFGIPRPLNAIMFHDYITIFESRSVFYLCYVPLDPTSHSCMWQFGGRFSSVEDWIENADWNVMEELEYKPDAGEIPSDCSRRPFQFVPISGNVVAHDPDTEPSARSSGDGFRIAAHQPYQKRTLWDMAHLVSPFHPCKRSSTELECRSGRIMGPEFWTNQAKTTVKLSRKRSKSGAASPTRNCRYHGHAAGRTGARSARGRSSGVLRSIYTNTMACLTSDQSCFTRTGS